MEAWYVEVEYYGTLALGIFSSLEKAEQAIEKYRAYCIENDDFVPTDDDVYIGKFTVDKIEGL